MIIIKKKKTLIIIVLLIFICCYYVANSGYYEYHLQERTILTNEKIKEFEEDVKNNNNIDVKNYLENEEKDYTNNLTNIVYTISDSGTNMTRKLFKKFFKKLSYLVKD